MSIDHILASITSTPLMITPDKLSIIMDVLGSRQQISLDIGKLADIAPVAAAANTIQRPANEAPATDIAVISIVGSLVHRASAGGSGMVNYRRIKQRLDKAMNDPDIGGILLDIDSHGGMAAGCHRLAKAINKASKIKPIYAFVDVHAFSAAYYIASACTKVILADETAGVGSVGVIALHRDQSAHNEKEGYKYTAIYSGAHKTDYSPHKPLADDLVVKLQASVDRGRLAFASAVAEFRGIPSATVLATEAGLYYGKEAIANGFADEIATLEETIDLLTNEMIKTPTTPTTGGPKMTTQERFEALISGNEDAEPALAALGFVKADQAEAVAKKAGHEEGVAAGLATANDILQVATLGQAPLELTASLIKKGANQEEAMVAVQQHRANLSSEQNVNSTITTLSGDAKHPLIASCEKLAG